MSMAWMSMDEAWMSMDEHGQSRAKGRGINQDCAGTTRNVGFLHHLSQCRLRYSHSKCFETPYPQAQGEQACAESQWMETKHPVSRNPSQSQRSGTKEETKHTCSHSAHAHAQMRNAEGKGRLGISRRTRGCCRLLAGVYCTVRHGGHVVFQAWLWNISALHPPRFCVTRQ